MRIACVGAGPAGLYLAILMMRQDSGHEVTVFEQNARDVTHGWGVVFWPDLVRDLQQNDPETATTIVEHAFRWQGQVLAVEGRDPVVVSGGGFSMRRQTLLEILLDRACRLGVSVRFEQRISDPSELPVADLIVAADGVGSPVRRLQPEQFGTRIVEGRNKYVWLGSSKVFNAFTFGFARTGSGWIWFHAYGIDRHCSTFIVECSSETWAGLGLDRMGARASLALLEELFAGHLEGERLLRRPEEEDRLSWLSFRRVTNEKWHAGNVVLVGDAARTAHFSIGSGTRLAIQDVVALARCLSEQDLSDALQAYQAVRQSDISSTLRAARLSAQWFENIPRYIGLDSAAFCDLMLHRRSPWMPHLPPGLYHQLSRATRDIGVLQQLRRLAVGLYS